MSIETEQSRVCIEIFFFLVRFSFFFFKSHGALSPAAGASLETNPDRQKFLQTFMLEKTLPMIIRSPAFPTFFFIPRYCRPGAPPLFMFILIPRLHGLFASFF